MKARCILVCMIMVLGFIAGAASALDPLNDQDPDVDADRDGLTNIQEYRWGTDPTDPDSDGGGCYDGWEVWFENHRAVDVDTGEPLIDDDYHFGPNLEEDEGVVRNVDHLVQVRDRDANVDLNDPDGDGWNNLHESMYGTDPTNPNTDGDRYREDCSDPDPLVSNGQPNDFEDDHPYHGNGGGGSGKGSGQK